MLEVKFYDTVDDALLKFAVIISQSDRKLVLCKHKERDTYEVPGGHREAGEDILETAQRELQEETGAVTVRFGFEPSSKYGIYHENREKWGDEGYMVCILKEGSLEGVTGTTYYYGG